MFDFDLMSMVAGIPGLIIALAIHEYAHALVADRLGDPTPRMMGRLTLNPVAHIDPIGLIMLFVARFGWAKPVMIDPSNFRNWRTGEIWVALAGPASNLLIGFLAAFIQILCYRLGFWSSGLNIVITLIIIYNVNFAIFNLIPLPPLDGSKLLLAFLPNQWVDKMAMIERYSFLILIALMMTPVFSMILVPLSRLVLSFYSMILGIFF